MAEKAIPAAPGSSGTGKSDVAAALTKLISGRREPLASASDMKSTTSSILGTLLLGWCFATPGTLLARDIEYRVVEGRLEVLGYVLNPRYPIPGDDYEGRVIAFHPSPDGRWVVIQSGYRVEVDLWLYDTETEARPVRIDTDPGNHTSVNWHGNGTFEVFWAGMGSTMGELFRVDDLGHGARVDQMLHYDAARDIYVSFFSEEASGNLEVGIEIGHAFVHRRHPERFTLDLDYAYLSNARFMIDEVEIRGNDVVVTYTMRSGEQARVAFAFDLTP